MCRCTLTELLFFFLMIRRPPRSTLDHSSAASDVYKRQALKFKVNNVPAGLIDESDNVGLGRNSLESNTGVGLSLIHISEPTRPY